MAKHSISTQTAAVKEGDKMGVSVEQTVQMEEMSLPSPQELAQYKAIDARIVDFLINQAKAEQQHRHDMDKEKMKILRKSEGRAYGINWWGMCFALMALVVMMVLTAYALYLDAKWLAGMFGLTSVASIVSVFVKGGKKDVLK